MTEFGVRGAVGGATETKQDDIIAALGEIEIEAGDASAANQTTQITAEQAVQVAVEALTKQVNVTAVNNITFDADLTTYTSAEIDCAGYRKFLLRIILAVANTPTSIKINVQFSQGDVTYENYVRGPFGSLMYVPASCPVAECIDGEVLSAKMKINVVAIGTNGTDTFTLTCKVVLTR